MDAANWINLGILAMTGLVGLLSWLGARNAAREAREDQKIATAAANRSASAAEEANTIQARLLEIEEQRHQQTTLQAKRAELRAQIVSEEQKGWPIPARFLAVTNSGEALARNLEIRPDRKPVSEHEFVQSGRSMSQMSVGPGAGLKLKLSLPHDQVPHWFCEVAWDGDSGVRGEWNSTL